MRRASDPKPGTLPGVESFWIEADVPGGPDAARRARHFIRDELAGRLPRRQLADVTLLVTELVANGVRHGGAGTTSELQLRVEGRPAALRVEVADPGPRRRVAPRQPDLTGGGGLGLQIVERVASRWGVGDGPRTSVWFEMDWA
jgi:anti-sigma regulatory factor (Ser/Thr protein kinase)